MSPRIAGDRDLLRKQRLSRQTPLPRQRRRTCVREGPTGGCLASIPKAAQRAVTMRMRAAGGSPGFFRQPSGEVSPRNRSLAMDLAADMMVQVECRTGHEAILSDLMIAVIERFTPWRSFPLSIRATNISTQDPRIRRAAEVSRAATGRNLDIGGFAKEA